MQTCRREPEQGLRDGTAAGSAALMLAPPSARAAGSLAGGGVGGRKAVGRRPGQLAGGAWGRRRGAAGGEGTIGGRTTDRASSWPVGGGPVTHQLAAGPLVGGGLVARQRWSRTASNPKRAAGGSQGEKKGKCICVE